MAEIITGGCLCGALRYEADGAPAYAGVCYCADCRRVSGGGFVGFMGYAADKVRFAGPARQYAARSFRGTDAVRNSCPTCGSLVFGGIVGHDEQHTVYAGSLDDPARFKPTIALFNRDRPVWAELPEGVTAFETMPTERP